MNSSLLIHSPLLAPCRQGPFSCRNVHSGEERGQTAVLGADYLTFEGGTGDLVWVKISFPKPLVIDFSLTCKGVTFFFSVGYFFSPRVSLQ